MSSPSDSIDVVKRAAQRAGCSVLPAENQAPDLTLCGGKEVRGLMVELKQVGYSVVRIRRSGNILKLGIMSAVEGTPKFFEFPVHCSEELETRAPGLVLAFLGPDGVGKSTTVEAVMRGLKPVFNEQLLFHWRPQLIKPRSSDDELAQSENWLSINRHGDPPRGYIVSLLRLAGVFADYLLGHFRLISPALRRGALVVFDRYYHDILVDHRRYRYGGPSWLLPLLARLLPHREVLFVVLDAEHNVILNRKQEVSSEELTRQRRKYTELANTLPNCIHVRTDQGLEHTVTQVLRGVGDYLSRNLHFRLPEHASSLPAVNAQTDPVAS